MKHYFIILFTFVGILHSTYSQDYNVQIAVFVQEIEFSYFDEIRGHRNVSYEINNNGFYCYFIEGFELLEEAQQKVGDARRNGYLNAKVVHVKKEVPQISIVPDIDEHLYIINPIFFEHKKSRLNISNTETLDATYDYLIQNPSHSISLITYYDCSFQAMEKSKQLCQARERLCRDYLVNKGISTIRIEMELHKKPSSINKNNEGMRYNRRLDFKVLNANQQEIYDTSHLY